MKSGFVFLLVNFALLVFLLWGASYEKVFVYDNDAAGTLLTASAVILTGTAVIVAIVSFVGFGEIRDRAIRAAEEKAEEVSKPIAADVAREVAEPVAARVAQEIARNERANREVTVEPLSDDELARLLQEFVEGENQNG